MDTFKNENIGVKKVTISDVAEALNVSKTTVSRAISGKGRIGEDTRKRVLAYIAENDYKPSVIAKGLAQQKTYNIGMVIPADCDVVEMPFFQKSLQGVCQEASSHDYDIMIVSTTSENMSNLERIVSNHKVDGLILSRSLVKDKAAEYLKEQKIPFVLMGTSKDSEILQVDHDHKAGCCELVMKLLEKMRKIALIGGCEEYVVNRTRLHGYEDAFRNMKVSIEPNMIFMNCQSNLQIEQAVKKLCEREAECIVCMDDMICLQVMRVLETEGVRVPEQMRVASFYDSALLCNHNPSITSILFDASELGKLTCAVLLEYIEGGEVLGKNLLGYDILERQSSCYSNE